MPRGNSEKRTAVQKKKDEEDVEAIQPPGGRDAVVDRRFDTLEKTTEQLQTLLERVLSSKHRTKRKRSEEVEEDEGEESGEREQALSSKEDSESVSSLEAATESPKERNKGKRAHRERYSTSSDEDSLSSAEDTFAPSKKVGRS